MVPGFRCQVSEFRENNLKTAEDEYEDDDEHEKKGE